MNNFRDKLKQSGYDAEEAYFHKREQELIAKMREKNGRPSLTLIQGGASDDKKLLPKGHGANKKAA